MESVLKLVFTTIEQGLVIRVTGPPPAPDIKISREVAGGMG